MDIFKNINIEDVVEFLIKYSLLSSDKFISLMWWSGKMFLHLAIIVIIIVAVATLAYLVAKRFSIDFAEDMKKSILSMLEENFYESEIYEALKNLASSIAGAIATMLNTISLIITLFFNGFSVIISYPFNIIQNILNKINYRIQKMNKEQKRRFAASKKEESFDDDDYSCRNNKYRLRRKDRKNDRNENKPPRPLKMEAESDGKIDQPFCNESMNIYKKEEVSDELSLHDDNNGETDNYNKKNNLSEEQRKDEADTTDSLLVDIEIPNDIDKHIQEKLKIPRVKYCAKK